MHLKKFQKMTKLEVLVFCLMSMASGVIIGVGGTASLLCVRKFGAYGSLIGGVLFSLGIYTIVVYEMRLFTGMVADIPHIGLKNSWQLPVCFIFNILGVAFVALLVYASPVGATVIPQAKALISAKLNAENWGIKSFCSAILCGLLITISVKSVRYAPQKGLNVTVGVLFPIIVFAFCGFDHSVANMLYFYYLGECSWRVVGYILLSVAGNVVGGGFLPMVYVLKHKIAREKMANQTEERQD